MLPLAAKSHCMRCVPLLFSQCSSNQWLYTCIISCFLDVRVGMFVFTIQLAKFSDSVAAEQTQMRFVIMSQHHGRPPP